MTSLVLVLSESMELSDQEIFEIDCLFPNELIAVVSPGIGRLPPMMRLTHFTNEEIDSAALDRLLDVMPLSAVLLRPDGFGLMSKSVLSAVMSRSMPRFYQFSGSELQRYKFPRATNSRVIFIYPGVFAPTSNGSTQRAFSFLLGLLSAGHQVEVVIPYGKGSHNFKVFLKQFGIGVHQFSHGRYSWLINVGRNLSKRVLNLDYYLPYFARLKFALSPDFKKCLKNILKPGDKIVASYAWMYPAFIGENSGVDIIVDTHDVNFVRDKNYYRARTGPARLLERLNKWLEIRTLNKADRVLAISESDLSIFRDEGLLSQTTLLEPSFEWIQGGAISGKGRALNFGFIGSNMVANRLAVDEILNNVWPKIIEERPEATLYIAGGICDYFKDRENLGKNIIPLGFVTSLKAYFSKVDALISPIMMQGGLNFKVIESLCCGVPVLVNQEAEHLKKISAMVSCYETDDDIRQFLVFADEFIRNPDERAALAATFRQQQTSKFRAALAEILEP